MQRTPCEDCKHQLDLNNNKCKYCQHFKGNRQKDNFKPLNSSYNITNKKEEKC